MKHKVSISKSQADEASHHAIPTVEGNSRVQRIILWCAVTSMISGMGCWLMKHYAAFFFFGVGVLLMGAVYAIEFKRTQ